jgi:glucokinase
MYIGIDIGGTHTRVASANVPNQIIQKEDFPTTSYQETISSIVKSISRITQDKIKAIGISSPGPLSPDQRILLNSPNLPGWENQPLGDTLEQNFHCPVTLEHDAAAAAIAEYSYGAGIGSNPLLYLTLSTGIGGGVIKDGQVFKGVYNLEIGHQTVDKTGPRCNCGRRGCLEALVSGWAIEKKYGHPPREINQPEVWEEIAANLAVGIANSIFHYSPAVVVLGGGLVQKGSLLFKPLEEHLKSNLPLYRHKPLIKPAALGQDSGLIGALILAQQSKQIS